jgi:hypothetical protein
MTCNLNWCAKRYFPDVHVDLQQQGYDILSKVVIGELWLTCQGAPSFYVFVLGRIVFDKFFWKEFKGLIGKKISYLLERMYVWNFVDD